MRNLTLLTDFYEITMGYGFFKQKKHEEEVVFDIFFRQNKMITYSLFAGLEQAMDYLLNWHFSEDDIAYLRSLNTFDEEFLEYLKNMRFTGDVYAVKEGEPVFPGEPILTIKAPLIQAQFAETALLNIINHQTLIATKAAKICRAAQGGVVMEFGLRRAQGPDAGIYGARAAIIGGLPFHFQRHHRADVRRARGGNDGAQLGDGLRKRVRGIQSIRESVSR